MLRADTGLIDLLHKGHDELRFLHNGVVLAVAVHHIHGVQTIFAACRHMNDGRRFLAQSRRQRTKFVFGIADQHIISGVENEKSDQLLGAERFARTGHTQQERRLVQKICFVAHDEVVGNSVLSEVNTALVLHFLHLKGHKHRKALGGEGTERIDPPCADGENGVQPVELLEFQNGKLAHMLSCHGKHRFGIAVELLFVVGGNDHRNNGKHHPLISRGQVVQKFLALLALELHIIGDDGGEIVVGILPALPIGNVGFDTEQTVFHLPHGLVGGDRHNIDRQHHISVEIGQLRDHAVFDIRSVVLQKQDPAVFFAQLQAVAAFLHRVGADIVLKVVPLAHHILRVKVKRRFFALTVEIMEHPQLFGGVQLGTLGAEGGEMGDQVSADPGKVGAGFFDVLFADRHRDIFLLNDAVGAGGLVQQHLIVFPAVHIAGVAPHGHQDRLLEIRPVQPAVVDGDFRRRSGIQTVQQLRIGKEHLLLVLTACHKVVDVGELIGLGKAAAHLKNTVLPDAADGDHILHLAGYGVPLLVLFQQVFQRFDHDFPSSNLSLSAS